jgi:hypothetical protein
MMLRLETSCSDTCDTDVVALGPGKGPHAGELRCAGCSRHRGWVKAPALETLKRFYNEVTMRFPGGGWPILRANSIQIGDKEVSFDDEKNDDATIEFKGFLPRDAERKTSKKGTDYFVISVGAKRPGGETKWVKVMVFDRDANPDDYVKGTEVSVTGEVKRDRWVGRDGEERTGWSCMTRSISIIPKPAGA